jgi:hypothetical protein
MATQIIPCDPVLPFWSQTTTLDGVPYLLTFKYNQRETVYYLDIASSDGTIDYVFGLKLVPSIPLLRPWATPPGELVVISQSIADDSPPALGDLADGGRCVLMYIPEADLFAPGNTVDPNRFAGFLV